MNGRRAALTEAVGIIVGEPGTQLTLKATTSGLAKETSCYLQSSGVDEDEEKYTVTVARYIAKGYNKASSYDAADAGLARLTHLAKESKKNSQTARQGNGSSFSACRK